MIRVATYQRVSTADQHVENQTQELRRYVEARGWTLTREYTDSGVSGAATTRPALDELLRDAKRRRFDAVVVWSVDRLGRNLKHLITLLDDFQALGIAFISLKAALNEPDLWRRFQRRNLIVHRQGLVDGRYQELTGDKQQLGSKLQVSPDDLKRYLALATIAIAGLLSSSSTAPGEGRRTSVSRVTVIDEDQRPPAVRHLTAHLLRCSACLQRESGHAGRRWGMN